MIILQRARSMRRRRRAAAVNRRIADRHEQAVLRAASTAWSEVTPKIVARAERYGRTATPAQLLPAGLFADPFGRRMRPRWQELLLAGAQFEGEWIGKQKPEAEQSIASWITQRDAATFPIPPSITVDMSLEMRRELKRWLKDRDVGLWQNLEAGAKRKLSRVLKKGLEDGLSARDMAKAVQAELTTYSRASAMRVARTETTGAMGYGQQALRDDWGIELKGWLATIDAKTRVSPEADHLSADGQEVANDGLFIVSGESLLHPGDVSNSASAANVINCRCASMGVV